MLDWNDYPILLAIARSKSLYRAAQELGVSISTVMRRLDQIEARTGLPLFLKTDLGYVPTPAGGALISKAEAIEQITLEAGRALQAEQRKAERKIRISASEVIAPFFVARHLPALRAVCPDHEITLTVTDQSPSQTADAFDISLWPSTPSNEDLFGRKLTDLKWALFGAGQDQLDDTKAADQGQPAVQFFGRQGADTVNAAYSADADAPASVLSTNSLIAAAALAASGGALAYLPCVLGVCWSGLWPLGPPEDSDIGELWVIYRKADRQTAHIRDAVDALIAAAQADRDLFLGADARLP